MKENQIEIFQKYLLVKTYEWHKNSFKSWLINPLQPGDAFLYPLKTSENLKVFSMFSGGKGKQHRAVMD